MLSFLHPGFLYAAGAAAAAVVALHFLVAEQPRAGVLPTVRFFPDVDVRATTLSVRLSDILLMLLRVATLLLIGAAFGQPRLKPSRSAILRIVAVDVSRDAASGAEVADSATRYVTGAAAVLTFDSTVREVGAGDAASAIAAMRNQPLPAKSGSLSSALIASLRVASRLRDGADSLELIVVSPFLGEERDSATFAIRALWPGRIRVVRVAGSPAPSAMPAKIEWADSSTGAIWAKRAAPDTVGGVLFAGQAVIYPFKRKWKLAAEGSGLRVTGRWIDGEPAVVEKLTADGCVRSVGVTIPSEGDAMLRPSFARMMDALAASCASGDFSPPAPAMLEKFAGGAALAPAARFAPEAARMTTLVPWLLGGALLLALLELVLRRSSAPARADNVDGSVDHRTSGPEDKAA